MKSLIISILLLAGITAYAQNATTSANKKAAASDELKTYVIEREIPGAGSFTLADLRGISQKSCGVLKEMGPRIQWMHSYVTGNKIYCIYRAENAELVKEHAKKGGFPANSVVEVTNVISPETANL